jgi:hypothetical protein
LKAEQRALQILTEYSTYKNKMDTWIVSEDSITIQCQRYVITIVGISVFVVLGSMAVPFAVRDSISGVDPFQFATFSWVLTGFFVAIAKSRYVSDWPWHHFLHGRIVCKSVSDVREVTGINDQMILMKLLHGERHSILKTTGPFNGMFSRKSEGGSGFSINEPVKLSTMLASGFIVFKVANHTGEHMICADVREGTDYSEFRIDHEEKYLAHMDIGEDFVETEEAAPFQMLNRNQSQQAISKDRPRKVFLLREEEFSFKKVIGVYAHDALFG